MMEVTGETKCVSLKIKTSQRAKLYIQERIQNNTKAGYSPNCMTSNLLASGICYTHAQHSQVPNTEQVKSGLHASATCPKGVYQTLSWYPGYPDPDLSRDALYVRK